MGHAVTAEIREIVPGLWIWRLDQPSWQPGFDWPPTVTSTVVESRGEVALLDPLAPPDGDPVWRRLDAAPPTLVVVLKPDHVRDVDRFVERYGCRAFGPGLFRPTPRPAARPPGPSSGRPTPLGPGWSRSTRTSSCPAASGRSTTAAGASRR